MSKSEVPAGVGVTAREPSVTVVEYASGQCYFRPDTEEFLFLSPSVAGEFELHWQDLVESMNRFHLAMEDYSTAIEYYGKTQAQRDAALLEIEAKVEAIDHAEDKLDAQRKAVLEKLGQFSTSNLKYDDVVELLPIANTRRTVKDADGNPKKVGKRYVYVKKKHYDALGKTGQVKTVKIKPKDVTGAQESIYRTDKRGKTRIDTKKLKEQLKAKQPEFKAELKDFAWGKALLDTFNFDRTLEWNAFGANLLEWAEAWNNSLVGADESRDSVDVSYAAQFMRHAANLGASAEYDPNKKNMAIKAEGSYSLALASAMYSATFYRPNRLGWHLKVADYRGLRGMDLGIFRLAVAHEHSGFLGASLQLEAQMQVLTTPDLTKQTLAGQPGSRLPRFRQIRTESKLFHQQLEAEEEGLAISFEAFAGLRLEQSLKGSLQWMKPLEPEAVAKTGASGEFVDFATLGGSLAELKGRGIGGKFFCTFVNGKFYFHVSASVCAGSGAKGALIAEVNVGQLWEFGKWVAYQLYVSNYTTLVVMDALTFGAYTAHCLMRVVFEDKKEQVDYGEILWSPERIVEYVRAEASRIKDVAKDNIEASRRRNKLAEEVLGQSIDLLLWTPEAKAILLFLLTRYRYWDRLDHTSWGFGRMGPDLYQDRKAAVLKILESVQTKREWWCVLCRVNIDGSLPEGVNQQELFFEKRKELIRFLMFGSPKAFNLRLLERRNERAEFLAASRYGISIVRDLQGRLKEKGYTGYALSVNTSLSYQLSDCDNPNYPHACIFGPIRGAV
ncbi:hypothetical protein [Pseudomonas sp. NPDC007930]|uniref:hypothetical protein n=1 Tax=Pseudomonas sp. NPDC007930 TaxID=3364417 RepID=UPI0036E24DBC